MGNESFLGLLLLMLLLSNSTGRLLIFSNDFHHKERSEFGDSQIEGNQLLDVSSVKRCLHHLGYLDNQVAPGEFNHYLEVGIKKYQEFFNLTVTGVLDAATVHHMTLPRCGRPDIIKGSLARKSTRMLYSIGGSAWPPSRRNLKYYISTANQNYSAVDLSNVFRSAFETWRVFGLFNFTEISDVNIADIKIGFYRGNHGDGLAFDGPMGTLALSFFPLDGRSHFDADEIWMIDPAKLAATPNSFDLQSVAVHEIGHLLGLGHSTDGKAVMFPTIGPQTTKRLLNDDDLSGIKALYSPLIGA